MANVTLTVPNKNGSYDGDMVVKQYASLTINAGDTLTVDQPCRGLLIYVQGDCTINGTLTMTARGAYANPTISGGSDGNAVDSSGLRWPFVTSGGSDTLTAAATLLNGCGTDARNTIVNHPSISGNGTILISTRDGGTGGAGGDAYNSVGSASNPGNSKTNGTGGGGSGQAYYNARSNSGGLGSCFSGGSGSGAIRSYTDAGNRTSGHFATDYGGPGGRGDYYGQFVNVSAGGAGNPGGANAGGGSTSTAGNDGTGGLLVLVVGGNLTIGASGAIHAKGSLGGNESSDTNNVTGGSSGGGRIIIAHKGTYTNSGNVSAAGGTRPGGGGGNGGQGSITVQQVT